MLFVSLPSMPLTSVEMRYLAPTALVTNQATKTVSKGIPPFCRELPLHPRCKFSTQRQLLDLTNALMNLRLKGPAALRRTFVKDLTS